jgi:hypothetical protein
MRVWLRLILAIIILFSAVFFAAIGIGTFRWNDTSSQMVMKLLSATRQPETKTVSFKDLDKLPAPVARYFRMALKEGQQCIRSVRIVHSGDFLTSIENNGWSPFTSTQRFTADPPGFVWDAKISMAPMMDVRVRDAYLVGKGLMETRVFSTLPVMDQHDKPELNEGARQRYLAEAIWFPTALLPSDRVTWSPMDDTHARATLTDFGATVSLEFTFNDKGEITRIFTPGRYREVNGKYLFTPWEVRVWNYQDKGGMRIPVEGEVMWQLPGGSLPYWKGRVVEAEYDFVK